MADDAATALARDGVCHMPSVLSASELATCQKCAAEQLSTVLQCMLLRQVLRRDQGAARYQEVVERDGGRLDVRHRVGDRIVAAALRSSALRSLLLSILGPDAEILAAGNVVAMSMEGWLTSIGGDDDSDLVLAYHVGFQRT